VKLGLLHQRKNRLREFENRVLRRMFGPKREEVAGEECIMRSFVMSTLHHILLG
jgi:hypothetical protein